MAMPKPASIADYEAACTEQGRAALAVVRGIVTDLSPEHVERLSYGIPTFFHAGRRVLHCAAWAEHLAIYPVPASPASDPGLGGELTAYVKGKGTLHFPYAVPLPVPLVARVVRAHLLRAGWTDPQAQ
jgi:uncharacterized protein YdhG (YjbR/CyaY superfamily)